MPGHRCRQATARSTHTTKSGAVSHFCTSILIPTYYVADNMGRQHTTWISEENWKKLQNIPGKSVSNRIGKAIDMADPDTHMRFMAKVRQLDLCKITLKAIQYELSGDQPSVIGIANLIEEVEHLLYEVNIQ